MQAVRLASGHAEGSTAYLNLETGDCHGDDVSLRALVQSGISRVVVGLKNPLRHCRGLAIKVRQVLRMGHIKGEQLQMHRSWI